MSNEEEHPLPDGWDKARMDEVSELLRGVSYKKNVVSLAPQKGFKPILRATNIQDERLVLNENLVYVPDEFVSEKQLLQKDDVVICMSSGSKHLVGKAARLTRDWEGSFGTFCSAVRFESAIEPRFAGYYFGSSAYRNLIRGKSSGININNLRRGDIEDLEFPVPPFTEQEHIANELEKQFTRLDQAVASLKRAQVKLKRYKASVLKAACEGRLVPQDPDDEPAEKLLERILTERRRQWEKQEWQKLIIKAQKKVAQARRKEDGRPARLSDLEPQELQDMSEEDYARFLPKNDKWKDKYKEPAAPETAELPEPPEGWMWASLEQGFDVSRGRFSIRPRNDPRYYDGEHPFVQIGDLPRDGGNIIKASKTLNDKGLEVSKKFPKGTVLIAIVGATIGNTGVLTFDSCSPDSLIAFQTGNQVSLQFLEMYLRSKKQEIRSASYASGGQPNINMALLSPYPRPLPPLAEQERIVAEVERRLSVIAANEKAIAADLTRADRLRQSILQQAFQGQLV